MLEYAFLGALIVVVVISAMAILGTETSQMFSSVGSGFQASP